MKTIFLLFVLLCTGCVLVPINKTGDRNIITRREFAWIVFQETGKLVIPPDNIYRLVPRSFVYNHDSRKTLNYVVDANDCDDWAYVLYVEYLHKYSREYVNSGSTLLADGRRSYPALPQAILYVKYKDHSVGHVINLLVTEDREVLFIERTSYGIQKPQLGFKVLKVKM